MITKPLNSKTFSVRYSTSMDERIARIMKLNMEAHGFAPTRNKILNAAVDVGLTRLLDSYQGDVKHE